MEIESFKDGDLQMRDVDTYNAFRYEKEIES